MSIILDGSTGITTPNIISPTQTILTKLDLTGGQIKFPATQVPSSDANTLDDYEEGTWTPTIVGGSTEGTATYVSRGGFYTKIGNTVYIKGYIEWTNATGTGYLAIKNIPFVPMFNSHPISIFTSSLTFTNQMTGSVEPSGIVIYTSINGSNFGMVQVDASATIWFAGTYQV